MPGIHLPRLIAKALAIFTILNIAYAWLNPPIGRLSVYNWLVKGRERLPTGAGNRPVAHNISPHDVNALFASHAISNGPKPTGEFRVVLLGDSQTWGWNGLASATLARQLNDMKLTACGRQLQFYNLAYPGTSVLKDFMIMHKSLEYEPDFVVWMVTLRSFTIGPRTATWNQILASIDPANAQSLLDLYGLSRYRYLVGGQPSFFGRTIVGQRAQLEKLTLMQLYGPLWDATGVDTVVSRTVLPVDLNADERYAGISPPQLPFSHMAFDVLGAVHRMIGRKPLLVVNEPIYMAPGENSDIRYNREYPRWAFDQYRHALPHLVAEQGWSYTDLYDAVPSADFVSIFHLTRQGEKILAAELVPHLRQTACP